MVIIFLGFPTKFFLEFPEFLISNTERYCTMECKRILNRTEWKCKNLYCL